MRKTYASKPKGNNLLGAIAIVISRTDFAGRLQLP